MSQPASPSDGFPALGIVPLGPDEPELFTDAMVRILRRLDESSPSWRSGGLPVRLGGRPE